MFCDDLAAGNPCAVVLLDDWLSDDELLRMTQTLAQPVTSFVVQNSAGYSVRWFTSVGEINLCGHGSLAAGAALIDAFKLNEVLLQSAYSHVTIRKQQGCYQIKLPGWQAQPYRLTPFIKRLGVAATEVFTTRDLVVVLESAQAVKDFKADNALLQQMDDFHALILTAQSGSSEYVLRYFTPKSGIAEDLATGSAQCSLAPYWFDKLSTTRLQARQLSSTGGYFMVEKDGEDSILISAQVKVAVKPD